MITHVVMWKFKDRTPEHVAHCKALLDGLPLKIEEIRDWSLGADVMGSPRSWDLVLISTFDDVDALERYRVHPDHIEVAAYISSAAEVAASVDFDS